MSVDYLRVSVTDRCNLRCIYCNPLGGCDFIGHREILRFEEIHRIVRLFVKCGITKVRLTGGEPLVRRNIVRLVRELAVIEGVEGLALTTNGVLLEPIAAELKAAGLQRVNISVDSSERESYKQITDFDLLPRVTRGIYKAIEVGLTPVKINSVIMRDVNVSQIAALAQMSVYLPVIVRFIEYCPTGKYTKVVSDYVPNSEVRKIIEREFGSLSAVLAGVTHGPALYFKVRNSAGTIGFISGRTSVFCRSCTRLRLTSDGKLRPCLYSAHRYDLKKVIRSGASDKQVLTLLERIIAEKHRYTKFNSFSEEFSMRKIGG
ncbi:MAG: GTP 3',8-cyclase MoaA [Planctomycetota bacterium]